MLPGLSLQIDVAGPWTIFTKSKQSILETREEKRTKRTTTKIWLLLAIDYFTSRLDVSPLENMTTGSLLSAIQEFISSTGYSTKRINMATESALQIGDICLITDLSSNSGRSNPLPALGRIEKFLDPESRSQAVLKYHSGKVDRPISKLVRVVKADEEISKKGKTICPYVLADEDIQANWDEEDEEVEDPHEDLRDALQPPVPGTGLGQDVHGHQESVPPPGPPRAQETPEEQEEQQEEEQQQEDDRSIAPGHPAGPLPTDYSLPQALTPNLGSQSRPKRRKNPVNKF